MIGHFCRLGGCAATMVMIGMGPAFAGASIPVPLAGGFGPVGLAVAGVGYVGYRLYTRSRNR